eukprot:Skav214274  [mRNA]  locus=scaffold642:372406:377556:- [translate_table: standard]
MRFTLALLFPALALAMRGDAMDKDIMDSGPKPWQMEAKTKKKKKKTIKIPKDLKVFVQKGFDEDAVEAAPKWVYQCRQATKDKSHTPISDWKECISQKLEAASKGKMTYKVEDMEIVHEQMEVNADPEAQAAFKEALLSAAVLRTMQNIEQKGGVHMDQHRRVLITQDGQKITAPL